MVDVVVVDDIVVTCSLLDRDIFFVRWLVLLVSDGDSSSTEPLCVAGDEATVLGAEEPSEDAEEEAAGDGSAAAAAGVGADAPEGEDDVPEGERVKS